MIISNTYLEARMDAIHILADFDCNLASLTITYREKDNKWCVEYEHLSDEDWERA